MFHSILHDQSYTLMGEVFWKLSWCSGHFVPFPQEQWRALQTGRGSRTASRWPPSRRPSQSPRDLPARQTRLHPNRYVIKSWFFLFRFFFPLILDQKWWRMISVCVTVWLPGNRWIGPAAAWPRRHRYRHTFWCVSCVCPARCCWSFWGIAFHKGQSRWRCTMNQCLC